MKSKKAALVFNWTLTLIVIVILSWTYLQFNSKYNKFEPLGLKQLRIFKTYAQAESALLYIEESAKYALHQSIYDLAQNGGISEIYEIGLDEGILKYDCGRFNNAYVWYELKKSDSGYEKSSCFDANYAELNLQNLFNNYLNQYLLNYPDNIPLNNYNYEIKNNIEIIGRAISPLNFDILKDEKKPVTKEAAEITIPEIPVTEDFVYFTGTELCAKGSKCVLTKEAYQLLAEAEKIAKQKRVSLEVREGYRDIDKQKFYWNVVYGNLPEDKRSEKVCYPYGEDVYKSCPHLSGKAVDIGFKGKTEAQMSNSEHNLRHEIMKDAGWVRYALEQWHFECCGTNRYARAKEAGVTVIV